MRKVPIPKPVRVPKAPDTLNRKHVTSCAEAARHSSAPTSPDEEFSVSGSCMSKHLQYPDTEAIPEDLNADG